MLTDSRSFLSYPRHELYRRCLCSYLGELVERGEYFSGEKYLKEIIEGICYRNVKEYFDGENMTAGKMNVKRKDKGYTFFTGCV